MYTHIIPISLSIVFLSALILPLVAYRGRNAGALVTTIAFLVAGLSFAMVGANIINTKAEVIHYPWLTQWGLDISFRLDGLAFLFAILIIGIGLLIVLYTVYYMPTKDNLGRFFSFLLAFSGSMLGIVISENILLMLVFWEMTSLMSFFLIAYKYDSHESRISARMALAVTGGGGLALLAGFLIIGQIAGSFELTTIFTASNAVQKSSLYPIALILILIGAFTKSAQFPFHFWLPNAMAAPTPVSAYLHSATMVKAGIFLLARFYPILSGTDLWFILVSSIGAITLACGAYFALTKHDLKGLLAYSTISHLGMITLLFGLDTPMSAVAGVFHIINHAIFKASLFMAAGIIDHECGTRDMRRIRGLFKSMPYTAVLGIVAASSMAGVPLLNGFLSKEMFFTQATSHPKFIGFSYVLPIFATIAGILTVAYSIRFIHDVFFNGEPVSLPKTPQEPPRFMRVPMEILVGLCLMVGIFPHIFVKHLLIIAAEAVLLESPPPFKLSIWHGFSLPVLMSLTALIGGFIYYKYRSFLFKFHEQNPLQLISPVVFERLYHKARKIAHNITKITDQFTLSHHLILLITSTITLGLFTYSMSPERLFNNATISTPPDFAALIALVTLLIGCLGTLFYHQNRFLSVIFLSVSGLVVSLTFIRFSAPDLALTQLLVEVVTIVLLLVALHYLPRVVLEALPRRTLFRNALISITCGFGMALLTYAMLTAPFQTISGYFLKNALAGSGGTNVVNVILVDFRGFDTLGEIVVLTLSALGIQALLKETHFNFSSTRASRDKPNHPTMLMMLMRPLLPLILMVSFYILIRGHNLPGGGFIAGLLISITLILQYLAVGIDFVQARLPINYHKTLALGLILVAGTGTASLAFNTPFLTSTFEHVVVPLIGKVELASAMVFDFGVCLVVVASILLIFSELGGAKHRTLKTSSYTPKGKI
jgi:multicomponent K+:H+ antiporter subunit A